MGRDSERNHCPALQSALRNHTNDKIYVQYMNVITKIKKRETGRKEKVNTWNEGQMHNVNKCEKDVKSAEPY